MTRPLDKSRKLGQGDPLYWITVPPPPRQEELLAVQRLEQLRCIGALTDPTAATAATATATCCNSQDMNK